MLYHTKSRTVSAIQWDGSNDHEIISFGMGFVSIELSAADGSFKYMLLKVDGEVTVARVDDWLVRDNGKLDFSSPRNFAREFDMSSAEKDHTE